MTKNYTFRILPSTEGRFSRRFYTGVSTVLILLSVFISSAGMGQETYTWQGVDGASWTVPANWLPERSSPATTDILQFNDGTTKTVVGVPSETIGQLLISNNTSVTLQSSAAVTLTIGGATGTDLSIASGSTLIFSATASANTITISILTGATGSVSGAVTFISSVTNTAHRLLSADASSLTFQGGAVFTAGTNFGGNAFGSTNLNSVIFTSGSTYLHVSGSNPFGAGQPNSVVTFQSGSLYKFVSITLTPSFSGRTYADFELDAPTGVITTTGGSAVSMNNLTITNGTLNFNMTGTPGHSIKGNITVAGGATLNFNPGSAGTVNLNGTSAQTISGAGTINNTTTTSTININNASGVRLNNAATFYNLTVATGTFTVASGASLITRGTVTGSVNVERFISGWTDASHGWHFLSSPVASQAIDPNFTDPTPANYDFYKWDEVTNLWLNQKVSGNNITTFVPGVGYLVAYQSSGTKQFSGTLNNSGVTASNLTISGGTNSGWNLAGNPFPCALKWNDGTNWTIPAEIGGVAKIWNEPSASYTDISANGFIPALNGFMVQVLSGSPASLTIPTAARVHNDTPWYKSAEGKLVLVAYDRTGNTSQQCVIGADEQATESFDGAIDCRFLAGYAPQFYSLAGGEMLSTSMLPSLDGSRVIELGFVKNQASEFSIGLDPASTIPGLAVYLTDKKTGAVTELKKDVEYVFSAAEGDDPGRFLLHFGLLGMDDPSPAAMYRVYSWAGSIYILSRQSSDAGVVVCNLIGQPVMQGKATGDALTTLNAGSLRDGIYLVRIADESHPVTCKVLIGK